MRGPHDQSPGSLQDLGRRAARADADAFASLRSRLTPGLAALLARRGTRGDAADEVLQRVWAEAWAACAAGRFDPDRASFSTYVYAITHHVWADATREAMSGGVARALPTTPAPDPAGTTALAELLGAVRTAMESGSGGLSDQERLALRLVAEGASDRELAQHLRTAPSTANQTKQAAYAKLRRWLARAGFMPESSERPAGEPEPQVGRRDGLEPKRL